MKEVTYKGYTLVKGSTARTLWETWQNEKKDRNAAQKKLDQHIKDVEEQYQSLMKRFGA